MQVVCHSDNQAVVADLRSRSSRHKGTMYLLRSLVFAEARLNCSLFPVCIETRDNYLADSLSSDNAPFFLSKVQSANAHPTTVSPHVGPTPQPDSDWSAPTWRQHFRAIFEQA